MATGDDLSSVPASVDHVAVRLPNFWAERPELWFSRVEIQLALAGITSDTTKFSYVVNQLEDRYAIEVEDIIRNPPARDKYEAIKTELISRLTSSKEQRIRQLLEHEEIGDRKPSAFLRHLKTLAGETVSDAFLKTLWLNRLPSSTHAILSCQDSAQLDDLARMADKLSEISPRAHVASASMTSAIEASHQQLMQQVAELSRQVAALSASGPRYRRPRSRSHSRNRQHFNNQSSEGRCWYHWRFGVKAKKCNPPCNFSAGNLEGGR
ncbi:uncharacterized protein LOC124155278 [Ischnura elegans]|uniref:uncharacterized protein LOC124155278 n=1 Tax=Ischnura elegans TaxID=197161 RepID=UPI001ED879FC|nr:uncharacterized protein LOC124155278 [Ischnura elegans]